TTTTTTTTPSTTAPIISREEINPSNGPKTTEAIETEVVDYGSEVSAPVPGVIAEEAGQPSTNPDGYGDPSDIWISKEGKMLKIEWEVAEESVCDAFLVNYTVLTLSQPKAFSVASQDSFVLIKMFTDHKLEAKVFCMLSGALSKTWWAHRIIDLSKPQAIHGLRVVNVETDDFYVAKIELEWDWPVFHDFKHNDIVVLYGVGKAPPKKLEVTEKGKVVLDKLEPTEEYIITVRNISRELGINSQDAIIKQQTRPIISSTLYPGQISSTSININFGESDPEQGKFEHYELDFTGNNKNITRKIAMDKDRSFTFTKLIPGKTYKFSLFTVYKSMRSRPVVAEITTYPLKVEKLRPIVGRDYASLHWDIENFADNDVRFRLSYIATSNDGARKERTVQLKNTNHYRFDELDLETYYTFTITVIMGIGEAEAESESEMVTVAFGKDVRSKPALKRHGTRELALIFENDHNMWHELNGPFNNFAVIVAEDIELGGDDYELRSWFEVHNDDKWPSYRASRSDYQPFSKRGVKEAMFIIGEDDCEQQRLDEPYCNGMLRANTKYLAKVRGYTDEGVAMETDWVAIHGHTNGQGDGDEDEEEEEDPGLPCHMYLNGCPRKGDKGKSELCMFTMATDLGCVLTSFLYVAIKEAANKEPGYSGSQSLEMLRNSVLVSAESCLLLVTNLCLVVTLYTEIKAAEKNKCYVTNNIGVSLHKYDIECGGPQKQCEAKRGLLGKLVAYGNNSLSSGNAKKETAEPAKDNSESCRKSAGPDSSCKTAQSVSAPLAEFSTRQKTSSPPKTAIVIPSTNSSGAQHPVPPPMKYAFDQPPSAVAPTTPKA
ncbi:unnamed protein product, partial [Mesorhabditis spiculigera]